MHQECDNVAQRTKETCAIFNRKENNLERDFRYLRDQHGDAGAREIFEKICSQLFTALFGTDAHNIKVSQGDEGIDILVGDFSAPSDVYQCKYFIDGIGDSQKKQIRDSFNRAINSTVFKMKSWGLCLPCELTAKEFQWWSEWKNRMTKLHNVSIILLEGGYLIAQLKKQDIYTTAFDDDIRTKLDMIQNYLISEKQKQLDEIVVLLNEMDTDQYEGMIFVRKLENANISEIDGCKRDFFNAELAEQAVKSQGDDEKIKLMGNLKGKTHSIWETQYRRYKNDTDGNDLLTRVYQRIEEMDSTTLDTPLVQFSMLAKKGVLHQWAEDCTIGWISDYITKLEQYLSEMEVDS